MKVALVFSSLLTLALLNCARGDTFGSGPNTFNLDFVTVGNPGNPADDGFSNPEFAGSVPYTYRIGEFEVSRDMVLKANSAGGLAITLADMTNFGGNGANRPASGVSWNESARFVNWLNTTQGFQPAYKFTTQPGDSGYSANQDITLWVAGDVGYNAANLFRNSLAHYFLPSVDEWYKAAHYNPANGFYYNYPTGSNVAPTPVPGGSAAGTAVYDGQSAPADIMFAGGRSPYATMGQGGNVFEWEETSIDRANNNGASTRGARGGHWEIAAFGLQSSTRLDFFPSFPNDGDRFGRNYGFRVASIIPEPSTIVLAIGALAALPARGRKPS